MTGVMHSSKGMSFTQSRKLSGVGNLSEKTRAIPDKPE